MSEESFSLGDASVPAGRTPDDQQAENNPNRHVLAGAGQFHDESQVARVTPDRAPSNGRRQFDLQVHVCQDYAMVDRKQSAVRKLNLLVDGDGQQRQALLQQPRPVLFPAEIAAQQNQLSQSDTSSRVNIKKEELSYSDYEISMARDLKATAEELLHRHNESDTSLINIKEEEELSYGENDGNNESDREATAAKLKNRQNKSSDTGRVRIKGKDLSDQVCHNNRDQQAPATKPNNPHYQSDTLQTSTKVALSYSNNDSDNESHQQLEESKRTVNSRYEGSSELQPCKRAKLTGPMKGAATKPSPSPTSRGSRRVQNQAVDPDALANNMPNTEARVLLTIDQEKYLDEKKKDAVRGKQTAPWSLLKALSSSDKIWSKQELMAEAEKYYGAPMEPTNLPLLLSPGYGAWSSMQTLEKKGLVQRNKGGSKGDGFSLTDEGRVFCRRLFAHNQVKLAGPSHRKQGTLEMFFAPKRTKS